MYLRYAESQGWSVETMSESLGEHGGYKEVIARLIGQGLYSKLKFESGAHRPARAGNRTGAHPHLGVYRCRFA